MTPRLTTLQRDVLAAFFARERGFFLTGGAALAGFLLGHRETHDLDLFTDENRIEQGERALRSSAEEVGARIEEVETAPDFRRRVLRRGDESLVVDLVRDRAPQGHGKFDVGAIRIDPAEEILANKLCTLLSRSELRDLVDARALLAAGLPLEPALELAARKDAGLTAAQLGWGLEQIRIGEDARVPGGVTVAELRAFVRDLRDRLAHLAFPG